MSARLLVKAFEEGVKAALKFFQSTGGRDAAAKAGEQVMKNMKRAVRAAARARK